MKQAYAIIRVDNDLLLDNMLRVPLGNYIKVVRIVHTEEEADDEVQRLQELDDPKGAKYFWQLTKVGFPDIEDPHLDEFIKSIPYETILEPYSTNDDPAIKYWLWVCNVPKGTLIAVENEILKRALEIWDRKPLPMFIGFKET